MHWNFENYKLIFVNSYCDYIVMYIFSKFWYFDMRSRVAEMAKAQSWVQRIDGSSPTEDISTFFIIYSFLNTAEWSY